MQKSLLFICVTLLIAVTLSSAADEGSRDPVAIQIDVVGAIGPATTDHIVRNLDTAMKRKAALVILRIDTPGGLDSAMRDIVKAILDSRVPVVSYVAPSGARAASAGTYILYASHIAAMAPATNIGAATPIQLGGLPQFSDPPDAGEQAPLSASESKLINDAAAYIRGLAKRHQRNADWAERAVREGVSLTAEEALANDVIDVVAKDLGDLLQQLSGRQVSVADRIVTLTTQGLVVELRQPDWRNRLLAVVADPNVAYILLLIGIYGLIFELANPGATVPGVTGAIALLVALYAFQVLPINYAGLALILLGVAFMVAEAFVPSFGVLGLGGVVAFVAGSVILLDAEGIAISIPLIVGTAVVTAMFFVWVLGRFVRLRRRKALTGTEEMIGSRGEALQSFDTVGRIRVHSENWRAVTDTPLRAGQTVRVVAVDGLTLTVQATEEDS